MLQSIFNTVDRKKNDVKILLILWLSLMVMLPMLMVNFLRIHSFQPYISLSCFSILLFSFIFLSRENRIYFYKYFYGFLLVLLLTGLIAFLKPYFEPPYTPGYWSPASPVKLSVLDQAKFGSDASPAKPSMDTLLMDNASSCIVLPEFIVSPVCYMAKAYKDCVEPERPYFDQSPLPDRDACLKKIQSDYKEEYEKLEKNVLPKAIEEYLPQQKLYDDWVSKRKWIANSSTLQLPGKISDYGQYNLLVTVILLFSIMFAVRFSQDSDNA